MSIYIHVYVYMCVCMCVCMYTHTYMYRYINVCMYLVFMYVNVQWSTVSEKLSSIIIASQYRPILCSQSVKFSC